MSRLRGSRAARALVSVLLMALLVGAPTALEPSPQGNCPDPTIGCTG